MKRQLRLTVISAIVLVSYALFLTQWPYIFPAMLCMCVEAYRFLGPQ